MNRDPAQLPGGLPAPLDDGSCDHLLGKSVLWPSIALPCTDGTSVDLSGQRTERAVVFCYPRTGVPGQPPNLGYAGEDWDSIPGARGCTPQSCGFRDVFDELKSRHVAVYGLSTNSTEHQRAFAERQRMPFGFLSDSELLLTRALRLPTFEFPVESGGPTTLLRRMAMYLERGVIQKVWYPVFPPDQNAAAVLHWLRARESGRSTDEPAAVRSIEPRDLSWVREELVRHWGATQISSLDRWHEADRLPGFIATRRLGVERIGLLTHTPMEACEACEIITLSSGAEGAGVGTVLMDAAVRAGRAAGCARMFLTTTNDNLRAIGFYQKRGWSLVAVHRGAMDRARRVKPAIPLTGLNGIGLHDEIELEIRLDGRP